MELIKPCAYEIGDQGDVYACLDSGDSGTEYKIEIEKHGGGVASRPYAGLWAYRVTRLDTDEIVARGEDLDIRVSTSHEGAVDRLWSFLEGEL